MNYTKPNDPEHDDQPTDWLASSLIMASALSNILKENEGVVVDVVNDMKLLSGFEDKDKVIVYCSENQIKIVECEDDIPNGQLVWMHNKE